VRDIAAIPPLRSGKDAAASVGMTMRKAQASMHGKPQA